MAEIGNLDQRVTIQRATQTTGSMGDVSKTWAALATVWAHVKSGTGREQLSNDRTMATQMVTFRVRYRSDVTEADRIVWKGQTFNIRAIADQSQRLLYMDITAERGVGNEN